jgi:hypothetical protein
MTPPLLQAGTFGVVENPHVRFQQWDQVDGKSSEVTEISYVPEKCPLSPCRVVHQVSETRNCFLKRHNAPTTRDPPSYGSRERLQALPATITSYLQYRPDRPR